MIYFSGLTPLTSVVSIFSDIRSSLIAALRAEVSGGQTNRNSAKKSHYGKNLDDFGFQSSSGFLPNADSFTLVVYVTSVSTWFQSHL